MGTVSVPFQEPLNFEVDWNHGVPRRVAGTEAEPPIQVHRLSPNTVMVCQSAMLAYERPCRPYSATVEPGKPPRLCPGPLR